MFKQPQKFENSPKFMVIFKPWKFEKNAFLKFGIQPLRI